MKPVQNETTGAMEVVIPAILKSVNPNIRFTKPTDAHPEGARFQMCTVEVTYPNNGGTDILPSTIWAKSIESNPDAFVPGNEVALTVQVDGEFKGLSKVGLPMFRRVNLELLGLELEEVEEEVEETA